MEEKGITLRHIMSHLQGLEQRINERFEKAESNMKRMERNLTFQIGAIDKRLDAVEIEYLPKRVSRIEKHLRLPPIKEKAHAA